MRLKLNYWQTLLLFTPILASVVIENWPQASFDAYQKAFSIGFFLLILDLNIIFYYQVYLALSFNMVSGRKSIFFKVNALIPVAFLTIYSLIIIYSTFIKSEISSNAHFYGPLKKSEFNLTIWIIVIFIVHALLTFFFINTQFVERIINKMFNADEQIDLRESYLKPMKRLLRLATGLFLASVLFDLVTDIVRRT